MGTTILGDMIVRYKGDVSDLSNKVKEAKSEISSVSTAAASSGNSISSIGHGFLSATSNVIGFISNVGSAYSTIQGIGQSLYGTFIKPSADMEQVSVGFETLLGKGKKTQDFLKQLQQFAAVTPFEFPELSTDAEHMLAFGFSAKEVIPDLTAIGDAMSAMGKSNAEIDSVVTVFGQMKAAGKVNAEDMMQLTSQGIPAWKMLAEAMHKTVPEVQDLSQKGLLPADQSIKMLTGGMEKMFGGGMKSQATTFNGLLSTFQDNANAALRAFAGPLFESAKTGLTKLGDLVSSKSFQDFATNIGQKLGVALGQIGAVLNDPIIPGFLKLVQIGGQVVDFFQQNAGALDALKVVGIAVGGAVIAALVVGFYSWAVAAGAAAIATLAATWPILLIGAAVALVVVGIILAIQHWGEITKWLSGVWFTVINFLRGLWTGFSSWFMGALGSIGAFFHRVWDGIVNGVRLAWQFIVNVVKIGVGLLLTVLFGPILAIIALFKLLYNHNTYFKQLVDAIVNFFKGCFKWLQDQWNTIINWIVYQWTYLKTMAEIKFMAIYVTIQEKIQQVENFFHSIFTRVVGFLQGIWDTVWGDVKSVWTKISGIFSSAWSTYVSGPLGKIRQGIIDWFSNLGNSALNAGKNFINMLVNGIKSGAGAIWDAVTGIAGNIWKALGFHSPPPEGPAKDSDKWMPNLINMLVRDLNAGAPKVQQASYRVATSIAYPIHPSSSASVVYAGGGSSSRGSAGEVTIIVELDSHVLAKATGVATDRVVRLKMGAHGRAA